MLDGVPNRYFEAEGEGHNVTEGVNVNQRKFVCLNATAQLAHHIAGDGKGGEGKPRHINLG